MGVLPIEESVSKGVEFSERLFWIHNQRVARYHAFLFAVHNRNEGIRRRLGAYPHPGEILLHQMPNEGGLPGRVLSHQQHHGLVVKVRIF